MATQRPLRFGILGAARIAPDALIKAAQNVPDAEVVAVAARDPKRAREFAAANGVPRVLATYQDLVNDPKLDVIYNPLPNSLHCEWTIAALRAGKHVLCEKPLASNALEAERMAKAADESGKILGEAFHYRYHPLADRIRALMTDGTLGRLIHVEGRFTVPIPETNIRFDWSLAGGATMDLGCYPLHMIRYFSGMTPRVIRAAAETGPTNIDIAMDVDLELAAGVSAKMICAMKKDSTIMASFSARGERGDLRVINPIAPQRGHQLTLKTASGEKTETVPGDTTFTHQLRAFVKAVRGEAKFPTDGVEGIINMRVIDEVYRAAGLPPRAT
ncbi:MAG: Gfo/Idh/MocA family oxidoreductase [Candidatus Binatus sp.]|jgi:predicted dehydrogenase|uniref:Gfo/Idh/MocA family protein n=1 Tax=Candidatus Binatus sp. TaxID=2811406 RepID=UPI003C76474E